MPYPAGSDFDSLGRQERPLERELTVAAEGAAGGDDTVIGQPWPIRPGENVPDRARRTRAAGEGRDIAIGGDPARRYPRHDGEDAAFEAARGAASGR